MKRTRDYFLGFITRRLKTENIKQIKQFPSIIDFFTEFSKKGQKHFSIELT